MGVRSNKSCTGPWDPADTRKVHYDFTGCPDDPKVYNEVVWGDSEDITFGQYNEVCAGAYLDITAGVLLEVVIGPMLEVCVGGSFEMAGMPAALWKAFGPNFQASTLQKNLQTQAAQYDIVFGTYYETLYDGAMYYWQPAGSDVFTVHENWEVEGTSLDRVKTYGNHAEVVGSKAITAGGPGGIRFIAGSTATATVLGASVAVNADANITVGTQTGILQLSGASASLQGTTSCAVNSTNAQLLLSAAGFEASSGGSLTLNGNLVELGMPGVAPPPVAAADDDDVPDDEFEDAVEPPDEDLDDEEEFFDAIEGFG